MKPTIGRIVHFHITKELVRPAIIVHVWSQEQGSAIQIQVFLDGLNDMSIPMGGHIFSNHECERGMAWRTSVIEGEEPGNWSWPKREE
jgi:hypothetical protein